MSRAVKGETMPGNPECEICHPTPLFSTVTPPRSSSVPPPSSPLSPHRSLTDPHAFDKHFTESKHAFGMRALGLPNIRHFAGITEIKQALACSLKRPSNKPITDDSGGEAQAGGPGRDGPPGQGRGSRRCRGQRLFSSNVRAVEEARCFVEQAIHAA